MYSTVVTRRQARAEFDQRIVLKTPAGDDVVGRFRLPAGLTNGSQVRIPKLRIDQRLPGYAWPEEGAIVRIRMPDWRLRNGAAALFLLAGLLAEAWPYTAALAVLWGVVAVSARHNRLHAVDRFDLAVPWRFWRRFRSTLAGTAMLYLVPVGMVIALYLGAAGYLRLIEGALTVDQLVRAQRALSALSDFFGDWVTLDEWPMFLALVGVYLLTCLLLARRGPNASRPDHATGRLRHRLARALNRIAAIYGRYSGPVAATLVTLASFTFLTNVPGALSTQLELAAVDKTEDYVYAVEKIEAELAKQVVERLYREIENAMPRDYQDALADPVSVQVKGTREQADRVVAPLAETDPDADRRLADQERRIQRLQRLPSQSVVTVPRGDPVAVPDALTAEQLAAARAWARSSSPDNRVSIINDSGRQAVLQLEKVASEPAWAAFRELVRTHFPLAVPMVDALAEACDAQLQEAFRKQVGPLVKRVIHRVGDMRAAIAAAAKKIVATVDLSKLVRGHTAEAARLAAGLDYLSGLEDRLRFRADVVHGMTSGNDFRNSIDRVAGASRPVQGGVVADLRIMMAAPDGPDGNPTALKHNAAVAIQALDQRGLPMITRVDASRAMAICGCLRG